MSDINLSVYNGVEAHVNSYLFTDSTSAVLVDCLRNSGEARKLAAFVKDTGKTLTHILITHGHADHYVGAGILRKEFPQAKFVVTKQEVKDDIISFSEFMDTVGWLDAEPGMKIKSDVNPGGFDYAGNINILPSGELTLANGATIEVSSDYSSAECAHLTTLYSKDLNAFFTGDFCYNGVHMWLAIEKQDMANWRAQLDKFASDLKGLNPKLYPGHGAPSDLSLFAEVKKYIEDFEATVASSSSRAEAMDRMKALYPDHKEADFLLLNSVNAAISE